MKMLLKVREASSLENEILWDRWSYYGGFCTISKKIVGLDSEEIKSMTSYGTSFWHVEAKDRSGSAICIVASRDFGDDEIVIIADTAAYLLNEQGQTIERLL